MMFENIAGVKKQTILNGMFLTLGLFYISAFGFKFFYTVIDPSLSISSKFLISRIIFWLWLLVIYLYVIKKERQGFLLWIEKSYSFGFSYHPFY